MPLIKVISVDNLDREVVADKLIAVPFEAEDGSPAVKVLQAVIDQLNSLTCHKHGGRFYKIVPGEYRLSRGMADLV